MASLCPYMKQAAQHYPVSSWSRTTRNSLVARARRRRRLKAGGLTQEEAVIRARENLPGSCLAMTLTNSATATRSVKGKRAHDTI